MIVDDEQLLQQFLEAHPRYLDQIRYVSTAERDEPPHVCRTKGPNCGRTALVQVVLRIYRELGERQSLASDEGMPVRQQLMERLCDKILARVPEAERPVFRERFNREMQQSLGGLR